MRDKQDPPQKEHNIHPRILKKTISSDTAMQNLGKAVAAVCTGGDIILLHGQLGAGKTTFSRGFIQGKGFKDRVKSPTFTLVEPYEFDDARIYHFDLYRLESMEELELIGWREYVSPQSICLIEWPEIIKAELPKQALSLHIDTLMHNKRRVTLRTTNPLFMEKLSQSIHDV